MPETTYPIVRNNTTIAFTPTPILKGGDKGGQFLMFCEGTTLTDAIAFLGQEQSLDILWAKCRQVFQEITKAATNQVGEFSLDAFRLEVANLEARTESKKSLMDKKDLKVTELRDHAEKAGTMELEVFLLKLKELSRQIGALNIAIENRSRKPADEAGE